MAAPGRPPDATAMEMAFFLWGLVVGLVARRPSRARPAPRWKNTVVVVGATAMAVVAATYRPEARPPPPAFTSTPPTFSSAPPPSAPAP